MDFDSFRLAACTTDLTAESSALEHADCLEFRMDLSTDPLDRLRTYEGDLPIVATNRAEWEGGRAIDEGRLDALALATQHDAVVAVDVELASIQRGDADFVIECAHEHDVRMIASTHDFEGTPSTDEMRTVLHDATEKGDVGKLAVTATDLGDVLRLLQVTHECTADAINVATMAMGSVGRHSRAVTPLYGSKIGYAPIDPSDATAPGQYDLETLSLLLDRLR